MGLSLPFARPVQRHLHSKLERWRPGFRDYSFNVAGPSGGTLTVTPYPRLTMNDMSACVIGGENIPAGPWLNYGNLAGSCSAPTGTAGILFNNPTGYSNSSGGSFFSCS